MAFFTNTSMCYGRRQWHPPPVLLPGKSYVQRSLVGCSPCGHQESDTTEQLHFQFLLHALEKEMATHSSVLAWRIPGTGKPGGLPSVGSHRVGHDWSKLAAAACVSFESISFYWLFSSSWFIFSCLQVCSSLTVCCTLWKLPFEYCIFCIPINMLELYSKIVIWKLISKRKSFDFQKRKVWSFFVFQLWLFHRV